MNTARFAPAPSPPSVFLGSFDGYPHNVDLPIELAEALSEDVYLPAEFERLTVMQRRCYAEWVNEGLFEADRRERAIMVCNVARVLAA